MSALLQDINDYRQEPIHLGALRHQCRRMGFCKGIQIRWSKEDIKYLLDNYRTRGDKEIAIELTKLKRTYRVINGQPVYRTFTKKHVEKKRKLLGIQRTKEEINAIVKRNHEIGIHPCFKPGDNLYTKGIKKIAPEDDTRIWTVDGKPYRFIKIDGKFIHYSRWFYQNYISPVPEGHRVRHKDFDTINDDPDNLVCEKCRRLSRNDFEIALALLNAKEKSLLKQLSATKTREQEKPVMADLLRIRGIIRYLKQKLNYGETGAPPTG